VARSFAYLLAHCQYQRARVAESSEGANLEETAKLPGASVARLSALAISSRYSDASAPADLFGCVVHGEGLKQSRRNSPLLNFGLVELGSTWQAEADRTAAAMRWGSVTRASGLRL